MMEAFTLIQKKKEREKFYSFVIWQKTSLMANLASTECWSDPKTGARTVNDLINKQVGAGSWCYKVRTLILDRFFKNFNPDNPQNLKDILLCKKLKQDVPDCVRRRAVVWSRCKRLNEWNPSPFTWRHGQSYTRLFGHLAQSWCIM